jgi:hypothetical protein
MFSELALDAFCAQAAKLGCRGVGLRTPFGSCALPVHQFGGASECLRDLGKAAVNKQSPETNNKLPSSTSPV